MGELFVIVMPVGPKYQHQYGIVEDSVHQAMLQLLHFQLCLIGVFKLIHGGQRLLRKLCNSSAEFIRCVFPCLYSSSPRLRLSKNNKYKKNLS